MPLGHSWCGKSSFYAPSAIEPSSDDVVGQSSFVGPVGHRLSFSVVREPSRAALIPSLLPLCCPHAIIWEISLFIVLAFYRMCGGWARANVFVKGVKRITPSVAYGNSATAVVLVVLAVFVATPTLYAIPSLPLGSSEILCPGSSDSLLNVSYAAASARFCISDDETSSGYVTDRSADAHALPNDLLLTPLVGALDHKQVVERLAKQVEFSGSPFGIRCGNGASARLGIATYEITGGRNSFPAAITGTLPTNWLVAEILNNDKLAKTPSSKVVRSSNALNHCSPPSTANNVPVPCVIVKAVDADTVVVERADHSQVKVRLAFVDAPEISHRPREVDQPGGQEALSYVKDNWLGKEVTVTVKGESYGRTVATIATNEEKPKSMGLDLVAKGLAMVDERYSRNAALLDAQKKAQEQKLGIWKSGTQVEAPWDFRKRARTRGK
jgi:endonuclease YncB( thermonuclease family)